MVEVLPPMAEIGCSLGAWDGAGKPLNRYNFGCMIASDSMFDSRGGFPRRPIQQTFLRLELLHVGDCQVGIGPHSS